MDANTRAYLARLGPEILAELDRLELELPAPLFARVHALISAVDDASARWTLAAEMETFERFLVHCGGLATPLRFLWQHVNGDTWCPTCRPDLAPSTPAAPDAVLR